MRTIAFLAALALTTSALASDPPKPNPVDPVDYVAWVNAQYADQMKSNAADGYLEALKSLESDAETSKAARAPMNKWSDVERERIAAWLKANEKCLTGVAAASRKKACFFAYKSPDGSVFNVRLSGMTQLREACAALGARARLKAKEGDFDGAVQDIAAGLRVSRHLNAQPMLIEHLVACATSAYLYDVLLEMPEIAGEKLPYARVVRSLKSEDPRLESAARQMRYEGVMLYDSAQRHLKDTDGDGRMDAFTSEYLEAMKGEGEPPPGAVNPQTIEEITAAIDEFTERAVQACDAPPDKFRAASQELVQAARDNPCTLIKFMGATTKVFENDRKQATARAAWNAVYRIHQFRAEHGDWPKTLGEAIPKSDQSVVIDAFSGRPLCYRLKDGAPLIYSVSVDGQDDGGTPERKDGEHELGERGDHVFWPRE